MSRVIPEEGDKGRGEPAPDHHQGPAELSTRRWYPEQPYPSRPDNSMGRIKKWPLPRIIVIDSSHIADFPSHPFISLLIFRLITSQHLPRLPRPSPRRQAHRQGRHRRYSSVPTMIGSSIAPHPPGRGAPSRPARPWPLAEASQAADCAENSPQRPSFGQTGRKALFPWSGGLTPVRGIINIRCVSTRQAIPP